MNRTNHDMQALGYLLNRWGRHLELMRFWHGFPTIEATYRAFFGPGAYCSSRVPIPDVDADIVRLNLRILALSLASQYALVIFYGYSANPEGGYYSDAEKAKVLAELLKAPVSEMEFRSRVYYSKKQLLSNLGMVQSPNLRSCRSESLPEPA